MYLRRTASLALCGAIALGTAAPAHADQASCRSTWTQAADAASAGALDGVAVGAALESRWNALSAGADFYARTAKADDCGDLLTTHQAAVTALQGLADQAAPYDVQVRVRGALVAGAAVVAGRPKVPKATTAALSVLSTQTATAVADLAPAYAELGAADPADAAAVARALKDLKLLSETSDAYVAVAAAVTTLGPAAPVPHTSGGKGG